MSNSTEHTIPGFIDLQVNGYKGVDFSSAGLSEESFTYACLEYLKTGAVAFLPTIITSAIEVYERNLRLISHCISQPHLQNHIPGIHLEGPFLSPEEGAIGAHNPALVKVPSTKFMDKLLSWSGGKIKLMTMAAEVENAAKVCRYAVQKGIRVSLGHQLAGEGDLIKLASAGATLLTHLGNGMPALVDRHQNPLLAGLSVSQLKAMAITDGHHLPAHLIKIILGLKGTSGFLVTSDASPIAGLPPGHYKALGNDVVLAPSGLLYNPNTGYMVGSSKTILECMNHLASLQLLDLEGLLQVGFKNQIALLGMETRRFGQPKVRVKLTKKGVRFSPFD